MNEISILYTGTIEFAFIKLGHSENSITILKFVISFPIEINQFH